MTDYPTLVERAVLEATLAASKDGDEFILHRRDGDAADEIAARLGISVFYALSGNPNMKIALVVR